MKLSSASIWQGVKKVHKTLAFTGLDFNLVKPYSKSTGLMLVMGIGMGIFFKSPTTLSSYFMMALMLIMSYPFAVSEKGGLETLYGTLSLSKINVVTGRYVFAIALELIFAVLALLCSWVLAVVLKMAFILPEMLAVLSVLSFTFSLIVAFQYPIYFKMGYTKGKILALVPFFAVFLIGLQIPTLAKMLNWDFSLETILTGLMENPFIMYVVPVSLGLILLTVSCFISCKIYTKRDI